MFEPLFDALGAVMNFFYTIIPSYGIAIMALTVLVMVVITPLTVKSTRSMMQMQRLQPEMKRIQEKYKNDREKLNAELMAFYKENKINPLGGCLPLIAQMPVFIIMYQLMRGLTVRPGGLGTGLGQISGQEIQGLPLTPYVFTDQNFDPSHLNPGTDLYDALSTTSTMNFLGVDLSLSASDALSISLWIAIPYFILLGIMLATGIIQNRQLQSRNSNASVNPQQQAIMKFMPFFLPVISFGFPAGLALYWCTQNLCRIGTNAYINRSIYNKEHPKGEAIEATAKEKGGEKGGAKGASKGDAKAVGKGAGNGAGKAKGADKAKGAGKGGSGSSNGSKKGSGNQDKGPGKSIKSQKAHEKSTGQRTSGSGGSNKGSGGGRKSGDRRKGSK